LNIHIRASLVVRWIRRLPGNTDVIRKISIIGRICAERTSVRLVLINVVQIVDVTAVVRHHPEETHLECLGAPAPVSVSYIIDDQIAANHTAGELGTQFVVSIAAKGIDNRMAL
jgi:hypothetical protein